MNRRSKWRLLKSSQPSYPSHWVLDSSGGFNLSVMKKMVPLAQRTILLVFFTAAAIALATAIGVTCSSYPLFNFSGAYPHTRVLAVFLIDRRILNISSLSSWQFRVDEKLADSNSNRLLWRSYVPLCDCSSFWANVARTCMVHWVSSFG
jgi:hypothetical protein